MRDDFAFDYCRSPFSRQMAEGAGQNIMDRDGKLRSPGPSCVSPTPSVHPMPQKITGLREGDPGIWPTRKQDQSYTITVTPGPDIRGLELSALRKSCKHHPSS